MVLFLVGRSVCWLHCIDCSIQANYQPLEKSFTEIIRLLVEFFAGFWYLSHENGGICWLIWRSTSWSWHHKARTCCRRGRQCTWNFYWNLMLMMSTNSLKFLKRFPFLVVMSELHHKLELSTTRFHFSISQTKSFTSFFSGLSNKC